MATSMDKLAALRDLGRRRQADRWLGYKNIGDYHEGRYEHEAVSPYSKTAANLDADVLVLLQDWASDAKLKEPFDRGLASLGHAAGLRTNVYLVKLLHRTFAFKLCDVYATNLFPFVKPGPMSESIRPMDLLRAGREYAVPQIDIVQAPLVICLGLATFRALSVALGQGRPVDLVSAMASPFQYGCGWVWCQAHPAARGRSFQSQAAAWAAMRDASGVRGRTHI